MSIKGEGLHNGPMTLQAISSDYALLSGSFGGLRLGKRPSRPYEGKEESYREGKNQERENSYDHCRNFGSVFLLGQGSTTSKSSSNNFGRFQLFVRMPSNFSVPELETP